MTSAIPNAIGITAIEIYIPRLYVDQAELEKHDGVSAGKYTIGLGQKKMSFCGDQEDINSLCLTVVHSLMDQHGIDLNDIGRLDVGTETIVDKSKSVKSVLMQLFESSGNTDVDGLDTTNACFGGTAALFNAVNWLESSSWDGRKAMVVMADIALYASGNARPTGGCGAVAMVLGPNAPLVFDMRMRSFHMQHVYDFYKPNMSSEYPVIDGQLSIKCFLSALDKCYERYKLKAQRENPSLGPISLQNLDHIIFHTPFCKLSRKALGRLYLQDYITESRHNNGMTDANNNPLEKFKGITLEGTFADAAVFRDVEKVSVSCSGHIFDEKTSPSQLLASNTGNMYTASLYSCLVSLLVEVPEEKLLGKRIGMFSYGSGLASCMFSLTVCPEMSTKGDEKLATWKETSSQSSVVKLRQLISSLGDVKNRLMSRSKVDPETFVSFIESRERICEKGNESEFLPTCSADDLFPGTYYLTKIDAKSRRFYERRSTKSV